VSFTKSAFSSMIILAAGVASYAQIFGTIRVSVIDPQNGSVPNAQISIRAKNSQWAQLAKTNSDGIAVIQAVPIGDYIVSVSAEGFTTATDKAIQVTSDKVTPPFHGWTLDFDRFHNRTRNAVDHEVLGNSSLLLPLTISHGRVRAYESTLHSPSLFNRLKLHYAFSYETAQGAGNITGGLTDFQPPPNGFFFLDQRVTLTAGSELNLPDRFWVSDTVILGSGFVRGNGLTQPDHMPHHTTVDVSVGKEIGENISLRATALNIANSLFLTGLDNSFAGTHYYAPRELSVQLRYRFHY
jgi:hypothetical protein